MKLSGGLILGNGIVCPLIIPNRSITEGLVVGAIAALLCIALYSYRVSRLARDVNSTRPS